jgi:hypothetical protein
MQVPLAAGALASEAGLLGSVLEGRDMTEALLLLVLA